MSQNKAFLIILDGWGIGTRPEVDAIHLASTPYYDNLLQTNQHSTLVTFGEDVGLPEGQMGNSEVGHLNIGAGRVIYQQLTKINKATQDGSLRKNEVFDQMIAYARKNNKPIHLMGLLSDGGVHSHIDHVKAILSILDEEELPEIYLHAFLDGRDTDPHGGARYVQEIINLCRGTNIKIASIIGRYYAMDRDNRYERIKLAYDLLIHGEGKVTNDPVAAIREFYDEGITDEFMKPILVENNGKTVTIKEQDAVLFFNFRTDRPRQITKALSQESFPDYQMKPLDLYFVSMTEYDQEFKSLHTLFGTDEISNTLGEVIQNEGLSQIRIAETEKYPHVTYFFSGGEEDEFDREGRIMVPSPKVATYDMQPEMSAFKITDKIIESIKKDQPDFICMNYANTDMVGHTGVLEAAIKAAETVDNCLSELIPVARNHGYEIIIIADHGNSDIMKNEDGSPHTSHTTNLVPVIYIGSKEKAKITNGRLSDIAPTILSLMDIQIPSEMDGKILVQ